MSQHIKRFLKHNLKNDLWVLSSAWLEHSALKICFKSKKPRGRGFESPRIRFIILNFFLINWVCPKSCVILRFVLCSIALQYISVLAGMIFLELTLLPYFCLNEWNMLSTMFLLLHNYFGKGL